MTTTAPFPARRPARYRTAADLAAVLPCPGAGPPPHYRKCGSCRASCCLQHARYLLRIEEYLGVNGEYLTLMQAARKLGVDPRTISRIRKTLQGIEERG